MCKLFKHLNSLYMLFSVIATQR